MSQTNLASEATKADWQRGADYPEIDRPGFISLTDEDRSRMALIPMILGSALFGVILAVVVIAWLLGPLY